MEIQTQIIVSVKTVIRENEYSNIIDIHGHQIFAAVVKITILMLGKTLADQYFNALYEL